MTDAEIIQYVYAKIGPERDSGIVKPLIIAMSRLAYRDLAQFVVDNDSELAKNLMTTIENQAWSSGRFLAPTDMLFHKQKESTRLDLGGTLAYQVEDRDKMVLLSSSLTNIYYALEGRYFYIRHPNSISSGNTLNLSYYKIPVAADINDDLRNIFLDLLVTRLIPKPISDLDIKKQEN